MRSTGELHDVGKVAIPDAILNKPGPLDAGEWEFVRRHSEIGERIVAAAPALGEVAPLVRATHERWDGSGYKEISSPGGSRGGGPPNRHGTGASIALTAPTFAWPRFAERRLCRWW